jgi:hypothetical protein
MSVETLQQLQHIMQLNPESEGSMPCKTSLSFIFLKHCATPTLLLPQVATKC